MSGAGPTINPAITSFFSGVGAAVRRTSAAATSNTYTIIGVVIGVVILIGLLIWYGVQSRLFETPGNIARIARERTQAQIAYAQSNPSRKGLRAYLESLKAAGVPDSQLILTNFYVSTALGAGIYFPAKDGVASPEAARAAVLAGARAFVFDIYPDLSPGARRAPSIQVVEEGSAWRRISINSVQFIEVLRALITEAFEIPERPGAEDPVFLYLRFRGTPTRETYDGAAEALRAVAERYRLDASYSGARAQDRIFTTPMSALLKKMVVFSNKSARGSELEDYINVGPKDGVKLEWEPFDVRGLTAEMRTDAIAKIKQNLSWIAPHVETANAEANSYDVEAAQNIGIQFTAMNFWNRNDALNKYLTPSLFGTQSFALKPVALRYVVEMLPDPRVPQNPNWGSGTTAGTIRDPPALTMP
jgi:hypothetical protein